MKSSVFQKLRTLVLPVIAAALTLSASAEITGIDRGWKFFRAVGEVGTEVPFSRVDFDSSAWESVRLPHTAKVEPLVVNDQWQGICWYRNSLDIPAEMKGKRVILEFDAAMNVSRFWLNGELIKNHEGGFLPVVIDVTDKVKFGEPNLLAVRLDNTDNKFTGPKPLKILDFNTYGGLYRSARIIYKEPVHISHAVLADREAGGGVFVTFPEVSNERATVKVKTHVINSSAIAAKIVVHQRLLDGAEVMGETGMDLVEISAGGDRELSSEMVVSAPKLWSPGSPHLYSLETELRVGGEVIEKETTRIGIRRFEFKGSKLFINGSETFLRGVNRHQEYPFIGYALSDNAQYRDAKKIKDAGFDYVRLSHYLHSPAFMDACDELGLVTLDAIPGWQYFLDDDRFRENCYRATRAMIRRDRNHPCVLAWEASLNETQMPKPFMDELHRIVHAEFPGDYVYSAGWMDYAYDIFLQARQHRILHPFMGDFDKPYMVSEYGDWEYYSKNAGLNQDKLDPTRRDETSSRQFRAFGEKRLLQQAYNLQEAFNDNLGTHAFSDAYWVMFDYNRGYFDDVEASGIMDIFRLPKFSYSFFKSQSGPETGAFVDIASYWTPDSALDIMVYANCDEVELRLNDQVISRQKPDSDKNSNHLRHPPFTFGMKEFNAGTLIAIGFIGGKEVVRDLVKSPGKAASLRIQIDESGRAPQAGVNDVVFAYIAAVDDDGTVVPSFTGEVKVVVDGDVEVLNVGPVVAEAGIATALIRIGEKAGLKVIEASSGSLESGALSFDCKE